MTPPIPLTRSKALRILEENFEQLERLGVEKIALYGSVARNEATAESDVDVLVELADEQLTLEGYMDVCFFLEELFGRRVDVTTFRSIKPHWKDYVLGDAVYLDTPDNVSATSGSDT